MVIEVGLGRIVVIAHIDYADRWVIQIGFFRLTALNLDRILGNENAACEEFVFVGAAWMSEDEFGHIRGKDGTVGFHVGRSIAFAHLMAGTDSDEEWILGPTEPVSCKLRRRRAIQSW